MGELIVDLFVLRNEVEGRSWGDYVLVRSWFWGKKSVFFGSSSIGMERKVG